MISIFHLADGESTVEGGRAGWKGAPSDELRAANETQPVLGGVGNVDKFTATFPNGKPIEGMTLRFFDPQTKLWSI